MALQKPESLENGEILPSPKGSNTSQTICHYGINTILGENERVMLVNEGSKPSVSNDEDRDLTGQR